MFLTNQNTEIVACILFNVLNSINPLVCTQPHSQGLFPWLGMYVIFDQFICCLVSFAAVFRLVTQRSRRRCVTSLKTAAKEAIAAVKGSQFHV